MSSSPYLGYLRYITITLATDLEQIGIRRLRDRLPIALLFPSSGRGSTELLRLCSSLVTDEHGPVILNQPTPNLASSIPLNQGSGKGHASRLFLTHEAAALHVNIHVDLSPCFFTCESKGLPDLLPRDCGLINGQRDIIDTYSSLSRSDRRSRYSCLPFTTSQ